jgi:hypothetical protein
MQKYRPLIRTDIDVNALCSSVTFTSEHTSGDGKVQNNKWELIGIETLIHLIHCFSNYRQINRSTIHIVELSIGA